MLSALGLGSPSLKITLAEELVFLHPSVTGPSEDPMISGIVTLLLPKARAIKSLTVRLTGKQDIGWPTGSRPYESSTTLERELTLFHGESEVLEKGEHTFEFSIIVPSATAPYERCQHGRVRHFVTAKAKGSGAMGGVIAMAEHVLFLIVNPGGEGESVPPPPLDQKIEDITSDLGPYTMALQSQHITVAGLLLFRFHLLCPPHAVQIYSIKVKINQKVVLHSAIEEGFTIAVPPDPRTVFRLDAVHPPNSGHIVVATSSATSRSGSQTPHLGPLRTVERDEDWKFMHLARVPNDNSLRPSTQEGSQTGIVIQHDIYVELQYRVVKEDEGSEKSSAILLKGKEREREREEKRTLVVSKPLDLHSCCCFLDSLTLPVYSLEDPHPTPDISPPCICSMELSRLIELQGDTLMREEGEMGITYATVQKYSEDSSRGGSGASTPVTTPTGMPSARGREGRLGLGSGWEGVLRNALLE